MQETQVWFLGQEDPLKKGMATYSCILVWKISWTEKPGGILCPWGCKESDATERLTHTYTHSHTHAHSHTLTHTVLVMKRKLRSYWENNSISIWKGIPSWWKVQTGFPGGTGGKEPPCQCKRLRDTGSIPGLGRSPGGRHDNPLQYSHLENSVDIGTWRAILHRVTESDITETTSHTCMSVLPK